MQKKIFDRLIPDTCILPLFFTGDFATDNENYTSYANECQMFKAHILNNDGESAITTNTVNKLENKQFFSCKQCQRSYALRKTLNRHLKECGKEKLFSCSLCDYRAHRNDRLMSHIRMVHPDSVEAKTMSSPKRKRKSQKK